MVQINDEELVTQLFNWKSNVLLVSKLAKCDHIVQNFCVIFFGVIL